MKPSKNWVYCRDISRHKTIFDTEKKALNFIKFNADAIREETGVAPVRAYYCMFCAAWHVTSKAEAPAAFRNEQLLKIIKGIKPPKQKKVAPVAVQGFDRQEYMNGLQDEVNRLGADRRKGFLEEEITRLKQEIAGLKSNPDLAHPGMLKQKNMALECTYIVRKQLGYKPNIQPMDTENADQLFWKRWAEQKGYLCA